MEKLKEIIEDGKYLSSLYDIQTAIDVYDSLVTHGKAITINEKVAKVCADCGINVKKNGVIFLVQIKKFKS